jgi:hypothetical protein
MDFSDESRARSGLPQGNATVFHSMMRVHFQVAVAFKVKIHRGMLGKQREHVVKERNARFDFRVTFAVEVQRQFNPGFERIAFDGGLPFHWGRLNQAREAKTIRKPR